MINDLLNKLHAVTVTANRCATLATAAAEEGHLSIAVELAREMERQHRVGRAILAEIDAQIEAGAHLGPAEHATMRRTIHFIQGS